MAVTGQPNAGQAGGAPHPGFEFYKPAATKWLEQGDLIPRSAKVIDVTLREYHRYHVEKPENELFAVLTQSCDLVEHQGAGSCKARYIALAPARPLRLIIEREFESFLVSTPGELFRIGSTDTKERYTAFLAKLINNNDSRFFFLPAKPEAAIAEDMCVVLPLSLAIRAEHYTECLEGRVAQIDDLFQAKLGWLLGQQYSRVGTPDWDAEALDSKVESVTNRTLTWFSPHLFEQVRKQVKKFSEERTGEILGEQELLDIKNGCRSKMDAAIDAVFEVLIRHNMLPADNSPLKPKLRRSLRESREFNKFFREEN